MTSKLVAEDNSGSVIYSGGWSLIQDSNAHGGTLHRSSNAGDYASLSFTGIVVIVVGSTPVCKTPTTSTYSVYLKSASDASSSSLGTQVVQSSQIQCTGPAQYQVTLFRSDLLSNEQHMVTLMNGQNTPLDLDFFSYATNNTGQAVVNSQSSSTSEGASSTLAKAAISGSLTTAASSSSASSVSQSESGSSSSRTSLGPGSSNAGLVTSFQTVMALTTINGVVTSLPVVSTSIDVGGSNGTNTPSGGSSKRSIGPIIGGITAGILVLLLLILLRRRRRAKARANVSSAQNMLDTVALSQSRPVQSSSHVSPFPLEPSLLEKPPTLSHHPNCSLPSQEASGQASSGDLSTSPERPLQDIKDPSFLSSSSEPTPTDQTPPSATSLPPTVVSNRPSSTTPSEMVPAYNRGSNNRPQYRSGLSTFTNPRLSVPLTLDVPPSYESVRNVTESPLDPHSPLAPQIASLTIVEDR